MPTHKEKLRESFYQYVAEKGSLSGTETADHWLAKIDEVLELPEEKELWKPIPWPEGKEGIVDSETVPIALKNAAEMRDNRYEEGWNDCLSAIRANREKLK